jgi:hypothetical protein
MRQPWAPLLKIEFGTFHPGFDAKNVFLFWARSSCVSQDSKNFPQNLSFPQITDIPAPWFADWSVDYEILASTAR